MDDRHRADDRLGARRLLLAKLREVADIVFDYRAYGDGDSTALRHLVDQLNALMSRGDGPTAFDSEQLTRDVFEVIAQAPRDADRVYALAAQYVRQGRKVEESNLDSFTERYRLRYSEAFKPTFDILLSIFEAVEDDEFVASLRDAESEYIKRKDSYSTRKLNAAAVVEPNSSHTSEEAT
jgi:hypothetical protein